MKEVLMLLLAMIIGFAGGTGMFALILHYCNGNEKPISKKENNVPTEVCAKSFEGMAMAFRQWERIWIRDIQGTSETAIRWPNKNLKKR